MNFFKNFVIFNLLGFLFPLVVFASPNTMDFSRNTPYQKIGCARQLISVRDGYNNLLVDSILTDNDCNFFVPANSSRDILSQLGVVNTDVRVYAKLANSLFRGYTAAVLCPGSSYCDGTLVYDNTLKTYVIVDINIPVRP
jgi:hypothetical protein